MKRTAILPTALNVGAVDSGFFKAVEAVEDDGDLSDTK